MRIAVDAMGGDNAPEQIVEGALLAVQERPELEVLLVGDQDRLVSLLDGAPGVRENCSIRHAADVIQMGESPVEALRKKPDSSIQRCMEALRDGEVDGVVSAGDTGGVVASATMFAPRLKGIRRQGIAIPVPTTSGRRALIIDVGANVHAKPVHLLQYAIMATTYAREVMGIENPRVGLLSVGEEAAKGNDLVKRSRGLLSGTEMNFVGNVEGQAIFQGSADVIVCDGFVGNVVLKVAEGLAESLFESIMGQVDPSSNGSGKILEYLGTLRKRLDYSATGGAPLLGVEGCVIICHGRSKARAIANAVHVAFDFVESRVNDRIVEAVAKEGVVQRLLTSIMPDGDGAHRR